MNARFIRSFIRDIILEGFAEDMEDLQNSLGYQSARRYWDQENSISQVHYRPWSRSIPHRRKLKKIFKKYADSRQLNNNVTCVHFLNYVPSTNTEPWDTKLKKFIRRYKPEQGPHTNELSTVGYMDPLDKIPDGCGIVLDQKYITFAYNSDAWTEETKTAYRDRHGNFPYIVVDTSTNKIVGAHLSAPELFEDTEWEPVSEVILDKSGELIRTLLFRKQIAFNPQESFMDYMKRQDAYLARLSQEDIARKTMSSTLNRLVKENPSFKRISFPEFYKASGIPKRPSLTVSADRFVLTLDDIDDSSGRIPEVIVDNWTYSSIYLHPNYIITPDMEKYLEKYNLKLIRRLP